MIKLNKETGELKLDYVTPILNEQTGVLTVSKTKEDLFTEKQVNQYFPIKYSREEVLNILDKFLESMLKGEKTGLIEEWFDETYGSKGSDECQFEPTTNTSSATICKHCGREKFMHTELQQINQDNPVTRGSTTLVPISSKTEISDEEIEIGAENAWSDYEYEEGNLYSTTFKGGWKLAIKWYREQLKQKRL